LKYSIVVTNILQQRIKFHVSSAEWSLCAGLLWFSSWQQSSKCCSLPGLIISITLCVKTIMSVKWACWHYRLELSDSECPVTELHFISRKLHITIAN